MSNLNIQGGKTWKDKDNQEVKRPEKIKVNLLANGKAEGSPEGLTYCLSFFIYTKLFFILRGSLNTILIKGWLVTMLL